MTSAASKWSIFVGSPGLSATSAGGSRRRLDVDVHATLRVKQLRPPSLRAEVADLEPEQISVEPRNGFEIRDGARSNDRLNELNAIELAFM